MHNGVGGLRTEPSAVVLAGHRKFGDIIKPGEGETALARPVNNNNHLRPTVPPSLTASAVEERHPRVPISQHSEM